MTEIRPDPENVATQIKRALEREEAQRVIAVQRAKKQVRLPHSRRTLADDLAIERKGPKYAIDGLHPFGGNSLLVAEKKAGKTTLLLNLMRALADDEPFLDQFPVEPLASGARVAFLNYELGEDMFRHWGRDIDVQHPERVAEPFHGRGKSLPFWDPEVGARTARWLRNAKVEWLIVDPAARAWSGLVDNENDNAKVTVFTDALDRLKRDGKVANLVLATHTGRAKFEEGQEQARGATRLEDWADSLWYLTKDGNGQRSLRATGRDVDLDAFDLQYLPNDRRLRATGETRSERRETEGALKAVDALAAILAAGGEPPNSTQLGEAIGGDTGARSRAIGAAERAGYIVRTPGPGRAKLCALTDAGRTAHLRKIGRDDG